MANHRTNTNQNEQRQRRVAEIVAMLLRSRESTSVCASVCVRVCVQWQCSLLLCVRVSRKFIKKQQPLNFYMRSVACFNFDQLALLPSPSLLLSLLLSLLPTSLSLSLSQGNSFKRNASFTVYASVCLCVCLCVPVLFVWPFSIWSRWLPVCERDKQLSLGHFHWLSKAL